MAGRKEKGKMAQSGTEEKKNIRSAYRAKRDALSPAQVADLSQRICAHLTASDLFAQVGYIYAYMPLGNEADLRPAVLAAWQKGKRVAFPKVFGDEMRFFEVTDFSQLAPGVFGIEEPSEAAGAVPVDWREFGIRCSENGSAPGADSAREPGVAEESPLLVLAPGVAFDRKGHRLGFGKGFYDRYFASCGHCIEAGRESSERDAVGASCTLLGVAYAFQIADLLPAEAHDLTVPYLVTEEGVIQIAR